MEIWIETTPVFRISVEFVELYLVTVFVNVTVTEWAKVLTSFFYACHTIDLSSIPAAAHDIKPYSL